MLRRSFSQKSVELLEPRRLLHGDHGGFHADINFQPASAIAADGYLVDQGAAFGDRGNGFTYGWNKDNSASTRERDAANAPDQRYDTLIHLQKNGSFTWEIEVPNGVYAVRLVAGDAGFIDSNFRINAEGTLALNGKPSTGNHWVEGATQVTVSDGRLTITNASGGSNNKLCFIEIESIETTSSPPPPAPPPPPMLYYFAADINFQPAASAAPGKYLIDSGATFADRGNGFTYGWNQNNSASTRDRDLAPDPRYDTLIHLQKDGTFKWEIAVPNGTYRVRLVAGDAGYSDSVFRINVEGTLALSGTPTSANRWIEAVKQVTVSDGRLTITNGSGASNNKICFIEIDGLDALPVSPPPPPPTTGNETVQLSVQDPSASEKNLDSAIIRFTRSGPTNSAMAVNYSISGSATAGQDYVPLTGTAIIPAGSSSVDVPIIPLDDALLEPAESILIETLPGAYKIAKANAAVITLIDDESSTTQQPYFGTPHRLSITVQAEDFDQGPAGISYHDKTAGNSGGVYRFSDVDIEPTTDLGHGFAVTKINKDDWLEYTVEIPVTGTYRIETRIASAITSGSNFRILFDGVSTGTQQFINTGGLQKWTTLTKTATLTAGTRVMRFQVDSSTTGGEVGSLNYIRLYHDVTSTSGVSWTSRAALPMPREEGQSASVGNSLYVFGGFYVASGGQFTATPRADRYDVATNTWTRIADMPEPITHAATVTVDADIWIIGGYVGNNPGPSTKHVWIYNTVSQTWSAGPDLPAERGGGGGGLIVDEARREVHFFGGRGLLRDRDEVDHWAFDLNNPQLGWQTRAPLARSRNHISGAVVDGRLYAIAGQQLEAESAINRSEVNVYDPATDTWTRLADAPQAFSHAHQSTLVVNGKIVTIGGEVVHNTAASEVLVYNPDTDLWSLAGYLPAARRASMAAAVNGQIVITGGYLNGKHYGNTWTSGIQ